MSIKITGREAVLIAERKYPAGLLDNYYTQPEIETIRVAYAECIMDMQDEKTEIGQIVNIENPY